MIQYFRQNTSILLQKESFSDRLSKISERKAND